MRVLWASLPEGLRRNYKPTIVFTRVDEGLVKGSGRSIECYNMFMELTRQKPLRSGSADIPWRPGLTLKEENLEILRENLNAATTLTEADFVPVVHIDVPMPVVILPGILSGSWSFWSHLARVMPSRCLPRSIFVF